jgi:hypothetical protein
MASKKLGESIAGNLRTEDWAHRKIQLTEAGSHKLWANTFEDYLKQRLALRYLNPIKILQDEGTFQGEGFTIVTIQCALIEFLAALKLGKNYKFASGAQGLSEHEYSNSSDLFCKFLVSEEPFKQWFSSYADAKNFYSNVRCALLHEARTKEGWRIWASGDRAVDVQKKIVRRDALQCAIENYTSSYGQLLMEDISIQQAFIRKFDHLSDI